MSTPLQELEREREVLLARMEKLIVMSDVDALKSVNAKIDELKKASKVSSKNKK